MILVPIVDPTTSTRTVLGPRIAARADPLVKPLDRRVGNRSRSGGVVDILSPNSALREVAVNGGHTRQGEPLVPPRWLSFFPR
ncbi:MAG: hypothetical protein CMJ23_07700 [Phycisphaerae bacterium]|nr:hypothetical protein [Phycisphaerae bacterium]